MSVCSTPSNPNSQRVPVRPNQSSDNFRASPTSAFSLPFVRVHDSYSHFSLTQPELSSHRALSDSPSHPALPNTSSIYNPMPPFPSGLRDPLSHYGLLTPSSNDTSRTSYTAAPTTPPGSSNTPALTYPPRPSFPPLPHLLDPLAVMTALNFQASLRSVGYFTPPTTPGSRLFPGLSTAGMSQEMATAATLANMPPMQLAALAASMTPPIEPIGSLLAPNNPSRSGFPSAITSTPPSLLHRQAGTTPASTPVSTPVNPYIMSTPPSRLRPLPNGVPIPQAPSTERLRSASTSTFTPPPASHYNPMPATAAPNFHPIPPPPPPPAPAPAPVPAATPPAPNLQWVNDGAAYVNPRFELVKHRAKAMSE